MCLVFLILPIVGFLLLRGKVYILYWRIVQVNRSIFDFPIIIDRAGILTSIVVLFISSNVLRFAMTYIFYDKFILRFNILVLLFVLSINILIYFPRLVVLLLGWDGLGLVRFLLVIYYQNSKSLGAGMITALTNRIGDAILLLAVGLSLNRNNWIVINIWDSVYRNIIIVSLIVARITKRAQFPFSRWLPAAIAAPTPVSALVHSSTLVTAGVFLLVRFYSYISIIKFFEVGLLVVACVTIIIAAFCAIVESDLKKIIALSTLRQLGVIITRLAIGLPKLALFHLITHALFKALLFVCAGNYIFLHGHNQDLRLVGNLINQLPVTSSCFIVGSISLCGLPFLSGFYSKDLILEVMLSGITNIVILVIVIVATGGTALYRIRLVIVGLTGVRLSSAYHNFRNEDKNIVVPVVNLSIGAIFGGCLMGWLFGPFRVECFLVLRLKLLPLYFTIIGGIIGAIIRVILMRVGKLILRAPILYDALCSIWFLSPISSQIRLYFFKPAYFILIIVDHGWVERVRAQGAHARLLSISHLVQLIQRKLINIIIRVSVLSILVIINI